MATTSLWKFNSSLKKLLNYVTNEEKTNNKQIEMCFKAYKDEKWQTQFD